MRSAIILPSISVLLLSVLLASCGGRALGNNSPDSGLTGSGVLTSAGNTNDYGGTQFNGLVYSFVGWDAIATTGVYPDKMTIRCTATLDPTLGATVAGTFTGDTNASEIGFGPKGEGLGGISVLNTSTANSNCSTDGGTTPGYISAIDIGPFDTTGKTGLRIFFEAAQISDQTREFGLRLQYSTDNGNTFVDYPGPVEFRSDTAGSSTAYVHYGPSAITQIDNQAQVYLRWRYYSVSGAAGSRTRIALRNIRITTDSTIPTFAGASGATSPNMNTINLSWANASDDISSAGYMRYDIYQSLTSGGQNYAAGPTYTVRGTTSAQITSLNSSTPYYFVVRARDEQGNRETNTVEVMGTTQADPNPPVISSFSPANGNLWPVGTNTVSVTFDKAMNVSTVNTTTPTMKVVAGTDCSVAPLTASGVAASNGNRTFTLTLTAARTNGVQYTTCVTTGVQSVGNVALASAASATWTATSATLLSDLIISEYMEGNSNNKFIEIYNGTGGTVNLDNYRLGQYNNGSATLSGTTLSFTAGTTLTHGSTWVVCHTSIDALLSANCNQNSTNVVNFNGNDAVVLQKNTGTFTDLDIIGNNTGDPGGSWNIPAGTNNAACTAGSTTCDTILKRQASVTAPTATPTTSFGQWNPYNASTIQNIEVYHGMGQWDSTPPTKAFNVVSAVGNAGTTVTVTYNFEPTTASGQNIANYDIRTGTTCGSGTVLSVSAAIRTGKTVALTTATQTNGQQYIVCVTNVVRFPDSAALSATNSAQFTGTADTTAPSISSTTPANNASAIAFNSTIAVTFNEAMNTGTVNGQTNTTCSGSIQVSSDNFVTCVAMASATPSFAGNTATLTPASGLAPNTTYLIRVTTAVQDLAGNPLASQFTQANGFTAALLADPTSLTFTPADTQITVGWTNSTNANTGVKILRATGSAPTDCNSGTTVCSGSAGPPVACNANITTSAAGLSFIDTGLTNGTQYFYRVCANHTSPAALSTGVTGSATPTAATTNATPTFSPVAGSYGSTQNITITSATSGVTICYTTSGADPTATTPGTCDGGSTTLANGGSFSLSTSATVKAIATLSGNINSAVGSAAYTIGSGDTIATYVVFSEISTTDTAGTGGCSGANCEYIELFNPTGAAINLDGWQIFRKSAANPFNQQTITITANTCADSSYSAYASSCVIPSRGFFLLKASNTVGSTDAGYIPANGAHADFVFTSGIANSANGLQLRKPATSVTFTRTVGNANLTAGNTTGIVVGSVVSGTGIQAEARVAAIVDGTTLTISAPPTSAGSTALTFSEPVDTICFGTHTVIGGCEGYVQRTGGATTSASANLTVSDTTGLTTGWLVAGSGTPALSGIPASATLSSITNGTTFVLSTNATVTTAAVTLYFMPSSYFAPDPTAAGAIERKAHVGSLSADMMSGGAHVTQGNGQDTGVNSNDWVSITTKNPQNRYTGGTE